MEHRRLTPDAPRLRSDRRLAPDSPVADALVVVIRETMTAAGIGSSRELGRKTGMTSQYVSLRLDGGSSRTGKRARMSVEDLLEIADAVGVAPEELLAEARRRVVAS